VIIRLAMANFDRLVKNLCAPAPVCHYRRQATDYFSELSHSFIAFHRF
jgi:histone H3/H4